MVKLYPYCFYLLDTDADRILDEYKYGSDQIFIKKNINIIKNTKILNIYLIITVNNINFS